MLSKVKLIVWGHIFNWFWRPRQVRKDIRTKYMVQHKLDLLKEFIPYVKSLHPLTPSGYEQEDLKIFSIWFQGEKNAPAIVKSCFRSIREFYGNKLEVLDDQTLWDKIELPEYIISKWKNKKIIPANFSDICRIELLYNYGGLWFDATDFLFDRVPDNILNSDFFMYVTGKKLLPRMFVQTCFMRMKKGDPLLGMWRQLIFEYWKRKDKSVDYFLAHMLLKLLVMHNDEARALFDKMPKICMDPTHILWLELANKPFDQVEFFKMKDAAFFQKCSYKKEKKFVYEIVPGSFADYTLNKMYKES